MAKVHLANLDPGSIPRVRGAFVVHLRKEGPVAHKWPRKRGQARSFADHFLRQQFRYAATMASNPEPLQLATAIELTRGTPYMPRDLLMRAIYGKAYEVVLPDGTRLVPADHGAPKPDQEVPFMGALAYQTASQFVTGLTIVPLAFDATEFDTDGWWSPANPTRLTVPDGVAFVMAAGQLKTNLNMSGVNRITVRMNGSAAARSINTWTVSGGQWLNVATGPIATAPGEYLELTARLAGSQNSSGTVETFLTAWRVG